MRFPRLFEPLAIGNLTVKNRLVFAPMVANLAAASGEPIDGTIAYYEARARGGAGTVICEASGIRRDGRNNTNSICVDDDALIPGLRRLAQAIRRHGSCAVIQLNHCGRQARVQVTGTQPVCPSPIPCPVRGVVPRELAMDEIQELVNSYASAAARCQAAGFDAVELHGAHGYLIAQFLSPTVNKRLDAYGGDAERRVRFAVEIVSAIRQRCGDGYPVFFRLSADEHVPGGLTLDDTLLIARRLVDAGVSVVDVSAGSLNSGTIVPGKSAPRGTHLPYAEALKRALNVPVIGVGKITDPGFADGVLQAGRADLVAVGRGLLADAKFAVKAHDGYHNEIQKCIYCGNCSRATQSGIGIMCSVNPTVGRELEFARPPEVRKQVLVVGSGLAALQTAWVAASRGHAVVLWARNAVLGGALATADGPHKAEAAMVVKFLVAKLRHSDVIRDGSLCDWRPDQLVIEAGSEDIVPADLKALPQRFVGRYDQPATLLTALREGAQTALAI